MSRPPGWYQAPDRPPGILAWWDGTAWGSERLPAAGIGPAHRFPGPVPDEFGWFPAHWDGPVHWKDKVRRPAVKKWRLHTAAYIAVLIVAAVVVVAALRVLLG